MKFKRAVISVGVTFHNAAGQVIESGADVRTLSTQGIEINKARSMVRDEASVSAIGVMDRISVQLPYGKESDGSI